MARGNGALLCVCTIAALCLAGRREPVSIPSSSMKKSFRALVVVPDDYHKSRKHHPVVYLLHGYSNDHSTWSKVAPLDKLADRYRCIFVCPDGNFNSWYIDSPVKPDSKFATYITAEVVPWIDSHYRTWKEKSGRAIVGSSMGGHGALYLLSRNPDLFCGAGSISGIMELAQFKEQWDLAKVLGAYESSPENWASHSAPRYLEALKDKGCVVVLDCGTSDFALEGNRKAHKHLLDLQIPHDYYERPGGHVWQYPQRVIEFHVLYFSRLLKPAR